VGEVRSRAFYQLKVNIQTGLGRGVKVSPSFQIGFMDQLFFFVLINSWMCACGRVAVTGQKIFKDFLILDPMTNQHVPSHSSTKLTPPASLQTSLDHCNHTHTLDSFYLNPDPRFASSFQVLFSSIQHWAALLVLR